MRWGIVLVGGLLAATGAHAENVDPSAYTPYTQKAYPKTFRTWGKAGVSKINKYMKIGAYRAAESPRCDTVETADLSDNRSSPPNNIVIFVDCANGERFYFTSKELENSGSAQSQKQKTEHVGDSAYSSQCEHAIQQELKFPSSMDKKWFSTNVYRAPQGNVVVTFDFDAKNGFGINLPQRARCVFDDRGMHPVEIVNR